MFRRGARSSTGIANVFGHHREMAKSLARCSLQKKSIKHYVFSLRAAIN
jgi:hypothetical protein